MATPPIPPIALSWGDQAPVTLDWTSEPAPTPADEFAGQLDFSIPGNILIDEI